MTGRSWTAWHHKGACGRGVLHSHTGWAATLQNGYRDTHYISQDASPLGQVSVFKPPDWRRTKRLHEAQNKGSKETESRRLGGAGEMDLEENPDIQESTLKRLKTCSRGRSPWKRGTWTIYVEFWKNLIVLQDVLSCLLDLIEEINLLFFEPPIFACFSVMLHGPTLACPSDLSYYSICKKYYSTDTRIYINTQQDLICYDTVMIHEAIWIPTYFPYLSHSGKKASVEK